MNSFWTVYVPYFPRQVWRDLAFSMRLLRIPFVALLKDLNCRTKLVFCVLDQFFPANSLDENFIASSPTSVCGEMTMNDRTSSRTDEIYVVTTQWSSVDYRGQIYQCLIHGCIWTYHLPLRHPKYHNAVCLPREHCSSLYMNVRIIYGRLSLLRVLNEINKWHHNPWLTWSMDVGCIGIRLRAMHMIYGKHPEVSCLIHST